MAGFFNTENKLWSAVNSAVDAILLNIMWLISCVPIITIGAATTAYYYTTHKVIRNQRSGIWKEYWSSFKGNFKQATKTWLIFLVVFAMFYLDINICAQYLKAGEKIGTMVYLFYGLLAIALIWFVFVFAYMARFEDTMNASWLFIPFVWFIPAVAMVFLNLVIEKVFRKYMTEEELAQEQENDMMRK